MTGITKVIVLWYKRDVFTKLLHELAEIWPLAPLNEKDQAIKDKSLSALRMAHRCEYELHMKQKAIRTKQTNLGMHTLFI